MVIDSMEHTLANSLGTILQVPVFLLNTSFLELVASTCRHPAIRSISRPSLR